MFSATLHSQDVHKLAERICQFPTWVDLKGSLFPLLLLLFSWTHLLFLGKDTIPDTVDLALVWADPKKFKFWENPQIPTDGVHRGDVFRPNLSNSEVLIPFSFFRKKK